jgi:hypothetical protein
MKAPVQIVLVLPDAASNKRVNRPEPAQPAPQRNGQWPLSQPIPDAEMRRALDIARREIANGRGEIARFLRSARFNGGAPRNL